MIATLNGETLPVSRQRAGVVWCPFCDRSRQLAMGSVCSCGAVFEDAPVAEVVETVEAAAPESEETTEDEPEQPRRSRSR